MRKETEPEKRNIVLTGMPGSGKTEVGQMLSGLLGMPHSDTDTEIVRTDGRKIVQIFKEDGEPYFRDLETDVIRRQAKAEGTVISTGGGSVLREENREMLRGNGIIVFLDPPLSRLLPDDARPLSDTREKLENLYRERMPVYREFADLTVVPEAAPEETAAKIAAELKKREKPE